MKTNIVYLAIVAFFLKGLIAFFRLLSYMRKLSLVFTISIILLSCLASAQSSVFRGISISDGLSDLLVNVIYKDSEGFVWVGTDNCLDRFDGTLIKHYPFEDNTSQKLVHAITEVENHLL